MFEQVVNEGVNDSRRCGCFVVNSAVELAAHDDQVADRVIEVTQQLEQKLHKLLDQAQKNGDLATNHDLQAMAQFLTNAVFGMRVMAKINPDQQMLTNVMNLALSVVD
jgi:TetR/AcrR family transcriptional repressor of nem operon